MGPRLDLASWGKGVDGRSGRLQGLDSGEDVGSLAGWGRLGMAQKGLVGGCR